jgi:gluconolactonase
MPAGSRRALEETPWFFGWRPLRKSAMLSPINPCYISMKTTICSVAGFLLPVFAAGWMVSGAPVIRAADAPASPAKPSPVIEPGAKLQLLADGFKFTEGPTADRAGNVFFTDQPNDRILRWSVDGQLSTWMQPCGRANGLCFDAAGSLIACADEKNELWSIAPDKKVTVLAGSYEGKPFNGPNDVWAHPSGVLYFTDPFYKRDYWKHSMKPQDGEHVYSLGTDRRTLKRIATGFVQPNGIVGTPDGKTLYVADIGDRKTYAFEIQADGSLTNRRLFCEMGSDGMTLDAEGNLYLTGKGVTVFNVKGEKIEHIPVDEGWTANACFGGRDRRTLFITAMDSLYGLRMRVTGAD